MTREMGRNDKRRGRNDKRPLSLLGSLGLSSLLSYLSLLELETNRDSVEIDRD